MSILTARDISLELDDKAQARRKDPKVVYGIPWPWKGMNILTGGIQPGEMAILMARPGKGKTAFMCQVAIDVARWVKENEPKQCVRLVICESSAYAIQMRMACAMAGVSQRKVRSGHLSNEQYTRFRKALDELARLPIEYLEPESLAQTRHFIREGRLTTNEPTGLKTAWWAVDYLQIHPYIPDKDLGLYQMTTKLSNAFRELAKQVAPGLVLSQMSRAIDNPNRKDKNPQLSDLRESGAIEQDASLVIAPMKDTDDVAVPEPLSNAPVPGCLRILKHRNGPLGDVPVEWFPMLMRYEDRSTGWSEEAA